MPINITDELHAATTKGKIASAKEVFLTGDTENLQQIGEKTHQLEDSIKNIAATGGASTAAAVTFDNAASGMNAVNAQAAIDEVSSISHFAKRGSAINISTNYNSTNTAEILTLSQAINKVPSKDRVLGFQGKYLASDGWHTIIYTGDSLSTWTNSTKWVDFIDKIFNSISKNATFAGIATPTTNPSTPNGPVFYMALYEGTYYNFSSIEIADGEFAVLYNGGSSNWKKITISYDVASYAKLYAIINALPCSYFDKVNPVWINGEYYDRAGDIGNQENWQRAVVDISTKKGTLVIFAQNDHFMHSNAYCLFANTSTKQILAFQIPASNRFEIEIPNWATEIRLSNRKASYQYPIIYITDIEKVATKTDIDTILAVLPTNEINGFKWLQGGISADGSIQDSTSPYYNNRIRISNFYEISLQSLTINVNSDFGYRIFEYAEDDSYIKYTSYDSGGLNSHAVSENTKKVKFCLLKADGSSISPKDGVTANFTVDGLGDNNTKDILAPVASIKYVDEKTRDNKILSGKKVAFIGDSITAGTGVNASTVYHKIFANLTGCINVNLGSGGTCIANNTSNGLSSSRFITRATSNNLSDVSLIVIFGGTNDFSYDTKAIGELFAEEEITSSGRIGTKKKIPTTDTDTFDGALHELIMTIRNIVPLVPIIIMTPLKRGRYAGGRPTSQESNIMGNYLDDFVNAIKQISKFYSIPVLDLNSVSNLDLSNSAIGATYSGDNLHPNAAGHKLIGNLLYNFVKEYIPVI